MTDTGISYAAPSIDMAEDIAHLHVASWREAYSGIVPASILENVDMADRIARWRSYLVAPGSRVYLARVDGEPAGFIRAGRAGEPLAGADGHIFALYVLERFHRLGIGRRLMGLVAKDWLHGGGRALSVGVLTANHRARAFYEALGAKFALADVYVWDGHSLDESIYLFENLEELAQFA